MHFVVLHAEFALGESQGAARSPLRGDPGGLRPPSAALRAAGAAPLLPRKPPKRGPPPAPADPCKPQALARRAAVLRTALAAGGRLRRRCAAPALRAALLPASHGIRQQTARLRRAGGRNPPKSSFGRFGLRPPFPSQKSQKGAPPTGKGAPFLFIRLTATFSGGNTVPTAPPPLPPLR